MKKMLLLSPVLILACFFGCMNSKTGKEVQTFTVNPLSSSEVSLSQIASGVEVIELQYPDDIFFGEIFNIKTTEEYIFLHDPDQTKSITIFDRSGKFVSQLKKPGRGPEEYLGIDCFTVEEPADHLIIYDRSFNIYKYSLPGLSLVEKFKVPGYYYLNIDAVGDKLVTATEELSRGAEYEGIQLLDLPSGRITSLQLPNEPGTISLSYPNTFTRQNNEVIYASPGHLTNIFRIDSRQATKIGIIDFGKHNVPKEAWNAVEAEDFESIFASGSYATWVQNVLISDELMTFFFVFQNPQNTHLAIIDKQSGDCKVYSRIVLYPGRNPLPAPIGTYSDQYLTLLYPENIHGLLPDDGSVLSDWQLELHDKQNSKGPVLLLYSLKR